MITTPKDYASLLYLLQDSNRQVTAIQLPSDEKIYNIDLNTRIIEAPQFLSVKQDHNAETIYFKVDRYFDNTDLSRSDISIVIQYENNDPDPKKRGFVYAPPFKDITTLEKEGKILFPWVIEGPATAFAGKVTFSIRFYKLNSKSFYEYNLNTLPCTSQVLHGMDMYKTVNGNYADLPTEIEKIYTRIEEVDRAHDLYWITIE